MKFAEVDLLGVYVAPISVMLPLAWVITVALRHAATRFDVLRHVWHPAMSTFSVYMIVLSSIVLTAAR